MTEEAHIKSNLYKLIFKECESFFKYSKIFYLKIKKILNKRITCI